MKSILDHERHETTFIMRSNTRERRLSTSALYVLFISNKYGIICSNLKDQSFEKWNSLGKRSVVENCKFWARMRATRLQCTPRKCSRMHAPTTLLFASLLPNAWQNEVKLGGCLRFGLENFNGHSHYDGRPFGKHCTPRWILLFMEIGGILNILLPYCCVLFEGLITIEFDTWREEEKKKDKIGNSKENLRKSICKFEYVDMQEKRRN